MRTLLLASLLAVAGCGGDGRMSSEQVAASEVSKTPVPARVRVGAIRNTAKGFKWDAHGVEFYIGNDADAKGLHEGDTIIADALKLDAGRVFLHHVKRED